MSLWEIKENPSLRQETETLSTHHYTRKMIRISDVDEGTPGGSTNMYCWFTCGAGLSTYIPIVSLVISALLFDIFLFVIQYDTVSWVSFRKKALTKERELQGFTFVRNDDPVHELLMQFNKLWNETFYDIFQNAGKSKVRNQNVDHSILFFVRFRFVLMH